MLSKGIMSNTTKGERKQFKSPTGVPITYTRVKVQESNKLNKGLYYPLARIHNGSKTKSNKVKKQRHLCVVYSKMFGREMYGNVDIWPDDVRPNGPKREKTNAFIFTGEDSKIIPKSNTLGYSKVPEVLNAKECAKETTPNKFLSEDNKKHVTIVVTDTSEEDDTSSSDDVTYLQPTHDNPSNLLTDSTSSLKRSHSVDSRDNPFLPGGNLSKEAEEILSKATIIRDTFILKDDPSKGETNSHNSPEKVAESEKDNDAQFPVRENIKMDVVSKTESSPLNASPNASTNVAHPKENGQVDTENSLTPGSIKVDIRDDDKNRKKQKKCCVVM